MNINQTVRIPFAGRILAIDYGSKRVGLAVSDALQMTANAFDTKMVKAGMGKLFEEIAAICQQNSVVVIVVGKPLNMDGSEGDMIKRVRKFVEGLTQHLSLPIVLWDERLTSIQAQNAIRAYGKKPSQNKAAIDKLAATFLLQSFLDSRSR